MKKFFCVLMILFFGASGCLAGQSLIIESIGTASMGDELSINETMRKAKINAKRNAVENASTCIRSESVIKDFMTEKDLTEAYAQAEVKVIEIISGKWFQDPVSGKSYEIKIKAEVIPQTENINGSAYVAKALENPAGPLLVKVWADKKEYSQDSKMKIYLKSNKPFFVRILYKTADSKLIQLLPNPYRTKNYFSGGVVHEIPSGEDKYELKVSPPFGQEKILVYAGTARLGDVGLAEAGSVYNVIDSEKKVSLKTRGIAFQARDENKRFAEFHESAIQVTTKAK